MRREIRIAGFGGQGVILCGHIIGKAASIFDGRNATMTQSFGPEARGSACSSQVIVDDERILYPYVRRPGVLVAMSQGGYSKFVEGVAPGATVLIESELVDPGQVREDILLHGIPSTRFAEELGRKIVQNIVMLGFFAAMADVASPESMKKAVLDSVPAGTEKLNGRAFQMGYDYGTKLTSSR